MQASVSSKKSVQISVFLAGIVFLLLGWRLFAPRYNLPERLAGTPCAAGLSQTLDAVTRNQGWFRTEASFKDLRLHKSFVESFDVLNATPFKEHDFFWINLRTSHLLWAGGPSAPHQDFVIAVDRNKKGCGIWKFSEATFSDDFSSYISDVGYLANSEDDVRVLGTLCQLLIPIPVREFGIRREADRSWVCSDGDSHNPWKVTLSLDETGKLVDFSHSL